MRAGSITYRRLKIGIGASLGSSNSNVKYRRIGDAMPIFISSSQSVKGILLWNWAWVGHLSAFQKISRTFFYYLSLCIIFLLMLNFPAHTGFFLYVNQKILAEDFFNKEFLLPSCSEKHCLFLVTLCTFTKRDLLSRISLSKVADSWLGWCCSQVFEVMPRIF